MKAFMIPPRQRMSFPFSPMKVVLCIAMTFDGCGTVAAVRLLNVQQTGCHVDCGAGFFRWMNKNIDYVKVIKKMDYKLFVLKEQNRNEMIVLI